MAQPSSSKSEQLPASGSANLGEDVIRDGRVDIAKQAGLEQMMVESNGRKPFQRVYLWASSTAGSSGDTCKGASERYNPETDGPNFKACPKLPQGHELLPADNAKAYMEVGLVCGDQPDKYMVKGKGRNKKQKRGILGRDKSCMRAYIPISSHIQSYAKFYIGCRLTEGRLVPRAIEAAHIFFYQEFWAWANVNDTTPAKSRLSGLTGACKYHAATNKSYKDVIAPITADNVTKASTRHPLAVTRSEHLSSLLVLQYFLYEKTGDRDYINAMTNTLDQASPELKYGPYTSNDGLFDFLLFLGPLEDELYHEVMRELKTVNPRMPDIPLDIIKLIHKTLCSKAQDDEKSDKEAVLGDQLSPSGLGFFLEICYDRIKSSELNADVIQDQVKEVLKWTEVHTRHAVIRASSSSSSSFSSWAMSKDKENHDSSDDKFSKADFRLVLQTVRDFIASVDDYHSRSMVAIAEQHGGILKHASLKSLMTKLGQSVDTASMQSLHEQVAGVHASMFAAKNKEVRDDLLLLDQYLDDVIDSLS